MPKLETPEEFAAKLSDRQHTAPYIASLITARDASLRAESATLLKTCGEALEGANKNCPPGGITEIKTGAALAALREAEVLE